MTASKTVRVGIMPGRINEFAVSVGQSIADVLSLASLSADGYEVKVDGVKVTDLNGTAVTGSTNLILLAKQVKGNMSKTIRVGVMPGRINEFAVEIGTPISEVLALAELDPSGFEVKVDGVKVDVNDGTAVTGSTNLILLAKQVKGNSRTIRVGVMPGRINEYAVDSTTTIGEALALAELSADGFEVKVDGTKVTDFNQPIGSANLILLAKQVKGNASRTVRIGVMPGRINEYAVEDTTTIADALTLAELNADGFEVKVDGTKVTDFNQPVGQANLILLAKQVKGNNVEITFESNREAYAFMTKLAK